MPNNKIAVIGDKDGVLAFKAIGVDVFDAKSYFDARETLKKLARDYSVIFITEDIAETIADTISRYKSRTYPAVIPIPSAKGPSGFGMRGLSRDVEKAIGSDILFGDSYSSTNSSQTNNSNHNKH
ncbi:MAG: V-type ATP synthase subunit F [Christensenellaceae bacterium]|jgi:V/A-type H+-transporting ATPase subunit F|nr:V-type ATP synthase subunit F [Christensenellaceae bacterium]